MSNRRADLKKLNGHASFNGDYRLFGAVAGSAPVADSVWKRSNTLFPNY
jgi:hypothetical protein